MIIQMYTKRGIEVDMPKRQQPNKRKTQNKILYKGKYHI